MAVQLGENFEACPWPRRSAARRWCIVQTEYRRERTAESEITAAGYLVYVPRYKTRMREQRNHRRWIDTVKPLFPGYLFVDVADEAIPAEWLARQRGVRDLVRQGIEPVRVPDRVIDRLRTDEGVNFLQPYRSTGPAVPYAVNDPVRITDGPFTGFYGTIERVDAADRITALIELFGRVNPVSGLSVDQIERASLHADGGA